MEWNPKAPGETVRYIIDWRDIYPDSIDSFTLAVSSGTVTLSEADNDDRTVYVLVSGGADGETAEIAHGITTADGQTLEKTITLLVSAGSSPLAPQTATKRTLVQMAREAAGLAGYDFDASLEEDASHLRRLDSLMATYPWSRLGYNRPGTLGSSDMADAIGIPDQFVEAASWQLAMRIAPGLGKSMSAEARGALSASMAMVMAYAATAAIGTMQLPSSTPLGAGTRPFIRNP